MMPYVTPDSLRTRRISGAFIDAGFPVPVAVQPSSAAYRAATMGGTFVDTKFVLPTAAGIPSSGAGRGTAVRGMSGGFVESKWIVAPISTGLPPARLGGPVDDAVEWVRAYPMGAFALASIAVLAVGHLLPKKWQDFKLF